MIETTQSNYREKIDGKIYSTPETRNTVTKALTLCYQKSRKRRERRCFWERTQRNNDCDKFYVYNLIPGAT